MIAIKHAGVVLTHVTVKTSICCVLLAGIPVPRAHAGRGNGLGDVVHDGLSLVERERGAEIGSGVLGRHAADAPGFDGEHSNQWVERDGDGGFAGAV